MLQTNEKTRERRPRAETPRTTTFLLLLHRASLSRPSRNYRPIGAF